MPNRNKSQKVMQGWSLGGILLVMDDYSHPTMLARYKALVHHPVFNPLHFFTIEELYLIAERLNTQQTTFSVHYPFSFAALALSDKQELAARFEALTLAQQCRILDVCSTLLEGESPVALVALSYRFEQTILLALAKNEERLLQRAKEYLSDPFIWEMIDPVRENNLYQIMREVQQLLESEEYETEDLVLATVPTTDELLVNWVFAPLLEYPFTIKMGQQRDRFNRLLPRYLELR